jgi:hypothetical protein
MKRTLLLAIALATTFAVGVTRSIAEDTGQQAPPAAAPAVPAQDGGKAVEKTSGCMPGGACCGDPACAQAAPSGEKAAGDQAEGDCPCAKMKKNKAM